MFNFRIEFANPWLLLLLIPAIFLTLFPFFRLAKRIRNTRNRVVSVVLHGIIMVLSVLLVSGIGFSYHIPNEQNEVIVLIDASDSGDTESELRNQFIYDVVRGKNPEIKMGVVTFGFNQVYAAPMSYDGAEIYDGYIASLSSNTTEVELDTTASDVASALEYASSLFEHPESGKIVLVSDGLETDREAGNVIRAISAKGIKVDTAYFTNRTYEREVQLTGVTYPEQNIAQGQEFELVIDLKSTYEGDARIALFDNGVQRGEIEYFKLRKGEQTVSMKHTFQEGGLHAVAFLIDVPKQSGTTVYDTIMANNTYYSYRYLEIFNDLLIIERTKGEATALNDVLKENFNTTVMTINDQNLPNTVEKLRTYDEVVLVNISNRDMTLEFVTALNDYVKNAGGGLFTVGGDREEDGEVVANAYNADDVKGIVGINEVDKELQEKGKIYQAMLPVEVINYTPPVAVMITIDQSGSMETESPSGKTWLELAKEGAIECLSYLNARDWCGIMSLDDNPLEQAYLMPLTQISNIISVIENVEGSNGGTQYAMSIDKAGAVLNGFLTEEKVQRAHIIVISDGAPNDSQLFKQKENDPDCYGDVITRLYENSKGAITTSFVCFSNGSLGENRINIEKAAEIGHGGYYEINSATELSNSLRNDLLAPEIKSYVPEEFVPHFGTQSTVLSGVAENELPALGGFYGTDLKNGASAPLKGTYVPVYAEWKYGKGHVGSFLCDLGGKWSGEFLNNDNGKLIANNIIKALFPTESVRTSEIELSMVEDNYTTNLSIYTEMGEGETIEVVVTSPPEDGEGVSTEQKVYPSAVEGFSRVSFSSKAAGIHIIDVYKKNAQGEVIATTRAYRAFSYSADYDAFADSEAGEEFMLSLALRGNGAVVTEADEVFSSFLDYIKKEFDPRLIFAIIILVFFLLDIAVRKFKFKWIHEFIRDRKAKNQLYRKGA